MRRSVNVERLTVRLRGVSPEAAREAAHGLGRELLETLARGGRGGNARIERVVANVSGGEAGVADGPGLRRAIARSVTAAVRARTK